MLVSERGCASTVNKLLEIGDKPISLESLAELIHYSRMHTFRIVRYLERDDIGVIQRSDGRNGVKYRYHINRRKAKSLGYIDHGNS